MGQLSAVNRIAELLRDRRLWIVRAGIGVIGLVAIGPPVTLVLAGFGVEDDDAVIAISIGDIEFIRFRIDEGFGREPEIGGVVAPTARMRFTDLQQELPLLGELENHVVFEALEAGRKAAATRGLIAACDGAPAALRFASIAADPDIALVIDGDAMVRDGPVIAFTRTAPVTDQFARLIEFEHWRSGDTALRDGWIAGSVMFPCLQRPGTVNDPDMILGIDGDADGLPENPVIRKRFGPQRIDFEPRRLRRRRTSATQKNEGESQDDSSEAENTLHVETLYRLSEGSATGQAIGLRHRDSPQIGEHRFAEVGQKLNGLKGLGDRHADSLCDQIYSRKPVEIPPNPTATQSREPAQRSRQIRGECLSVSRESPVNHGTHPRRRIV